MLNRKALKRTISFVLAMTACANVMFANAGTRYIGETVLTAFAEEEQTESFGINKTYLKVGDTLQITNPDNYTLKLIADGQEVDVSAFELSEAYYEKWITVEGYADGVKVAEDTVYFSKLPVVYIETKDHAVPPPEDKSVKVDGTMFIQNNTETETAVYDSTITLQGRGNTTWQWEKKPYKIKLKAKTDLYGMGESKKYVLLANYQDESLLRNTTASKLSQELGLTTMQTVWTDVILNGEYVGNYQLGEQVGNEKARVNILDWEKAAEDAADAIADSEKDKEKFSKQQKSALEEQMVEDLSWVTSGEVTFEGVTYNVAKYYKKYTDNISGGYLFESSEEYDEESKFMTENGLKIMMKSPEFLNTNNDMFAYVQTLWQDFENAYCSEDGYTVIDGRKVHYTEIADFDSMVSYWLLMEIMGNNDARYKSRYIYKPQDGLLTFGPPWDFDTGAGSILIRKTIDESYDPDPTGWKVSKFEEPQNFYREFLDDPYFVTAATEKYWQIRSYLEDIIRPDGELESDSRYLYESGLADAARWDRRDHQDKDGNKEWADYVRGYEGERDLFIQYMRDRIDWLDEQFASYDALINSTRTDSASPYTRAENITLAAEDAAEDTFSSRAKADAAVAAGTGLTVNAAVSDPAAASLDVYVNGLFTDSYPLTDGTAAFEIPASLLAKEIDVKDVISVIARNADAVSVGRNFLTVVQYEAPAAEPTFESHRLVLGEKIGVDFFVNLDSLTDAEKEACSMEFTVNGKKTTAGFDASFKNPTGTYYGFSCDVTAVEMADTITAVLRYGDEKTVSQDYSALDYINTVEEKSDQYSENTLALVRAIADYGHYAQPVLAANNHWTIGAEHAEMAKHYTDSYDYEAVLSELSDYARGFEKGGSDIQAVTNSLDLRSKSTVLFYIRPDAGYTGPIEVTVGSETVTPARMDDGRYCVAFPGISAHKLADTFTLTIRTDNGTATCDASALSYVHAVLTSEAYSDNQAAKDAVCAIYRYYTATMKYRNDG